MANCLTKVTPQFSGSYVGALEMKGPLQRGALFKALYARDHAKALPQMPTATGSGPPLLPDWSADATIGSTNPDDVKSYVGLRNFAACVVLNRTAVVHRLLLASAGSTEENDSIAELGPIISACLPDGLTLQFSRAVFIGLLAETAQRLAVPAKR